MMYLNSVKDKNKICQNCHDWVTHLKDSYVNEEENFCNGKEILGNCFIFVLSEQVNVLHLCPSIMVRNCTVKE